LRSLVRLLFGRNSVFWWIASLGGRVGWGMVGQPVISNKTTWLLSIWGLSICQEVYFSLKVSWHRFSPISTALPGSDWGVRWLKTCGIKMSLVPSKRTGRRLHGLSPSGRPRYSFFQACATIVWQSAPWERFRSQGMASGVERRRGGRELWGRRAGWGDLV
jgi:hypothetical protein